MRFDMTQMVQYGMDEMARKSTNAYNLHTLFGYFFQKRATAAKSGSSWEESLTAL